MIEAGEDGSQDAKSQRDGKGNETEKKQKPILANMRVVASARVCHCVDSIVSRQKLLLVGVRGGGRPMRHQL
jgi:hypothetical protein